MSFPTSKWTRPVGVAVSTGPRDPDIIDIRWASTEPAVALDAPALNTPAADIDAGTAARIATMLRPEDRRRSRSAHGLLRRLVGSTMGIAPSAVTLTRRCVVCGSTDHGKPEIANLAVAAMPPPSISLSHSAELVIVALGPAGRPVGVDVEALARVRAWGDLRRHVFSDAEWEVTTRAAAPDRERLRGWVRKEATAKATGHGLALGLERVQVGEPHPGHPWAKATGPWSEAAVLVADIDVGAGYVAAAAIMADASAPAPVIRVEFAPGV